MGKDVAAPRGFDGLGWHLRGRVDPSPRADIYRIGHWILAHARSRPATYTLATAARRTYVVLVVEGGIEFETGGAAATVEAGSLVLLDGAVPITARTLSETAGFVWHFVPTFVHPGRWRFRYGEPIRARGASVRALTSMTRALLRAPATTDKTTQRHLALSFENLLAGVLEESGGGRHSTASPREGLFTEAQAVIETHFRDRGFTVPRLAAELLVSVRTLHEIFSNEGTTPRREIERRRVREARELSAVLTTTATDLAARSGFTSARQLTRALARTGTGSRV